MEHNFWKAKSTKGCSGSPNDNMLYTSEPTMQTIVSIRLYLCILIELHILYLLLTYEKILMKLWLVLFSPSDPFLLETYPISVTTPPLWCVSDAKSHFRQKKLFFYDQKNSSIIENEFGDYWKGGLSLSTSGLVIGIIFFVITVTQFIPIMWVFVRDDDGGGNLSLTKSQQ